jgi:perosamine synthetase
VNDSLEGQERRRRAECSSLKSTPEAPFGRARSHLSLEAYKASVQRAFSRLKRIDRPEALLAARIPIAGGDGFLVPVCELHASDPFLIATLAQWRAENAWVYPTQFTVTLAGTALWLRSLVLAVEDRMMFLVVDRDGRTIGHMGFADAINDDQAMRLDNVIRGVKGVVPGLMTSAYRALQDWAERLIGPRTIYAIVFSDNERVINFLARVGFEIVDSWPLRRHVEGERVVYRPLAPDDGAGADRYHTRMVLAQALR